MTQMLCISPFFVMIEESLKRVRGRQKQERI